MDLDGSGLTAGLNLWYHYDGFAPDLRDRIRKLVDGDREARVRVSDYLWEPVVHKNMLYPATAPAALLVGEVFHAPELAGQESAWLRWDLLAWLSEVGDAAAEPYHDSDDKTGDVVADANPPARDIRAEIRRIIADNRQKVHDFDLWDLLVEDPQRKTAIWAQVTLDCRRVGADLLDVALSALSDPDAEVRAMAGGAVAGLANAANQTSIETSGRYGPPPVSTKGLIRQIADAANRAEAVERTSLVTAIGALGGAPREFLADPHLRVRLAAATAPALATDAAAKGELVSALSDPRATELWFRGERELKDRWCSWLVRELLERTTTFEEILPAAVAVAGYTKAADPDWLWLLARAFPERVTALAQGQRAYLAALVANDRIWTGYSYPEKFDAIGLPHDREAIRALLEAL
jgi:hypothetical protein